MLTRALVLAARAAGGGPEDEAFGPSLPAAVQQVTHPMPQPPRPPLHAGPETPCGHGRGSGPGQRTGELGGHPRLGIHWLFIHFATARLSACPPNVCVWFRDTENGLSHDAIPFASAKVREARGAWLASVAGGLAGSRGSRAEGSDLGPRHPCTCLLPIRGPHMSLGVQRATPGPSCPPRA